MPMPSALIGLGANLGPREEMLRRAAGRLVDHPAIRVAALSRFFETPAVGGPPGQPPFLNAAAHLKTSLAPESLLDVLHDVERALGRERGEHWGPRVIDLDLLLYDQLVLQTERIVLPHRCMAWRRFVLEPAAEVAPRMLHPILGWTVAEMLAHLNATAPYLALAGPIGAGKTSLARTLADHAGATLIEEEVDSARLDCFYCDPSGTAWEMEIEFLRQRGDLLSRERICWQSGSLVTSDFWFEQSLAFAAVWLPTERLKAFRRAWEEVQASVVRPRLVVLLDAPVDLLVERIRRRGRGGELALSLATLERIRQAILRRATRRGVGPVLRLTCESRQSILGEVLAAAAAML